MSKFKDNLNILLDFYYELREVRFRFYDNYSSHSTGDGYKKKLLLPLETALEIPLETEIEEMGDKVRDFFVSKERFHWVDGQGAIHAGLNPSLSYDELDPFLFGDCSNLSGFINSELFGDVTYLFGELNPCLKGRIFPYLEGDISKLYGKLGPGVEPHERLSGVLNKDLTGDLSGIRGVINPDLIGNVSGMVGTINPKLTGDCTDLVGFISSLYGDCTGLRGRMINLTGDCSSLTGDCTGLEGDCTGLAGNLDNITWDLRPNRLSNFPELSS